MPPPRPSASSTISQAGAPTDSSAQRGRSTTKVPNRISKKSMKTAPKLIATVNIRYIISRKMGTPSQRFRTQRSSCSVNVCSTGAICTTPPTMSPARWYRLTILSLINSLLCSFSRSWGRSAASTPASSSSRPFCLDATTGVTNTPSSWCRLSISILRPSCSAMSIMLTATRVGWPSSRTCCVRIRLRCRLLASMILMITSNSSEFRCSLAISSSRPRYSCSSE